MSVLFSRALFLRAAALLRRYLALTLAAVCALYLSACAVSFPDPTPPTPNATLLSNGQDGLLVPLHVERADSDHARLGIPVQLDGKAIYLELDTGTKGMRVRKSVLGNASPASGPDTQFDMPSGVRASGPVVDAQTSLSGTRLEKMAVQRVDDIRCRTGFKRCVGMDGYTAEFGWAFSGLFGIGAQEPGDTCCTAPLRALPNHIGERYVVRARLNRPFLLLSPSDTLTRDFIRVPMEKAADGSASQWARGCVQVADKMSFCAPVVFATGSSNMIRIETDSVPNWADDADEGKPMRTGNFNVAVGIGPWVHRFDSAQTVVVKAKPGANRIVIGLMAMQNIDILFDFQKGQFGVRSGKSVEAAL